MLHIPQQSTALNKSISVAMENHDAQTFNTMQAHDDDISRVWREQRQHQRNVEYIKECGRTRYLPNSNGESYNRDV